MDTELKNEIHGHLCSVSEGLHEMLLNNGLSTTDESIAEQCLHKTECVINLVEKVKHSDGTG